MPPATSRSTQRGGVRRRPPRTPWSNVPRHHASSNRRSIQISKLQDEARGGQASADARRGGAPRRGPLMLVGVVWNFRTKVRGCCGDHNSAHAHGRWACATRIQIVPRVQLRRGVDVWTTYIRGADRGDTARGIHRSTRGSEFEEDEALRGQRWNAKWSGAGKSRGKRLVSITGSRRSGRWRCG